MNVLKVTAYLILFFGILVSLVLVVSFTESSTDSTSSDLTIEGCTVPRMHNYDPNATLDDESCVHYPSIPNNPPLTTNGVEGADPNEIQEATILFRIDSNLNVEVETSRFIHTFKPTSMGHFSHTNAIENRVYCRAELDRLGSETNENTDPANLFLAVIYLNSDDELMFHEIGALPMKYTETGTWSTFGGGATPPLELEYWRSVITNQIKFGSHFIAWDKFVHSTVVKRGYGGRMYLHTNPIRGVIYCYNPYQNDKGTISEDDNGDILWTVKTDDTNLLNQAPGYVLNVSNHIITTPNPNLSIFIREDLDYWIEAFDN